MYVNVNSIWAETRVLTGCRGLRSSSQNCQGRQTERKLPKRVYMSGQIKKIYYLVWFYKGKLYD